jgi:predicted MFS family arabinose efflux permease
MTFPVLTTLVVKSVGWQLGFSVVIVPALVVVGLLMMVLPETTKQSDAAEA